MNLSRSELESLALEHIPAAFYYDLLDSISECSNEELRTIIESNNP